MHCTSQRSLRTNSLRLVMLFREVGVSLFSSLFSSCETALSSSSLPQVAVEFIRSSQTSLRLLRTTDLTRKVIPVKFTVKTTFVTEGQAPGTRRLEAVTILVRFGNELVLREFSQGFLQLVAMVAREGELGAVVQDDAILAMKPGLQFLNKIQTNYRRAMYADELLGIEL